MKLAGNISKMVVTATTPVSYELPLGSERLALNDFLGKTLSLRFTQKINCLACQRSIKKSFQNGYCFPCTQKLAQNDLCILKPERCHFHLGTCREPTWGQSHCMIPHVVYLANASGIKVGITRKTQIPTRWIDQGAVTALPLFEVASRRISGLLEVAIAKMVSDKTNWRKMLSGQDDSVDLWCERERLLAKMQSELTDIRAQFGEQAIIAIETSTIERFEYPVLQYPKKISSLSFDKTDVIAGTLSGIKGQYLIFDTGVINIRKYGGYEVEITVSN